MSLDLIFPNFETLIRTPEDVARLNEAILQLAVQGRLVPQDPADEPAGELLKRIRTEKRRLVKEGKIREEKPLPAVDPREHGFNLPLSWTWARLGEIGQIVGGGTPSTSVSEYFADRDIPWLTPADLYGVERKNISRGRRDISKLGLENSSARLLPRGTVLFSSRAPIGHVAIAETDLATNQGFKSCIPYVLETNEYIYYFLRSARKQIDASASGTTFREVSGKDMSRVPIPLPPLAEQHRIVAKVESLFAQTRALEAKLRQAQADIVTVNRAALNRLSVAADADAFTAAWATVRDAFDLLYDDPRNVAELRQAILQLAVQGKLVPQDPADEPASELLKRIRAEKRRLVKEAKLREEKPLRTLESDQAATELPRGWAWARVGMLGKTQTGSTPSTGAAEFYGDDYPFVKPADISDKGISFRSEGLSRLGLETGRLIEANSVLMVCIGGSIGKVSYVDRDCSCNQQINALTPFGGMSARFLYYFLRSPYFQHEILSRAPQTTLPILSKGKWEAIALPLPPLAEQHRIVAKVDQLMRQCDALAAGLARAEGQRRALTAAALHRAFG